MFTFVRNPLHWYASYWAYRMETGPDLDHSLDVECGSENFEEFLWRVLERRPGYVTHLYEQYVGREDDTVGYVGRQENLREDLLEALHRAGEKFCDEDIIQTGEANKAATSESWSEKCKYSPELEEAVVRSEHRIMKRFGYIG